MYRPAASINAGKGQSQNWSYSTHNGSGNMGKERKSTTGQHSGHRKLQTRLPV